MSGVFLLKHGIKSNFFKIGNITPILMCKMRNLVDNHFKGVGNVVKQCRAKNSFTAGF